MLAAARTARATNTELRGIELVVLAGGVGGRVAGGLLAGDVGLGAGLVGDVLVVDGETDGETDVETDVAPEEGVATDVVAGVTDVSPAGLGDVLAGVAATGAVSAVKRVAVPSAAMTGHNPRTTSTAAAHSTAATRGR